MKKSRVLKNRPGLWKGGGAGDRVGWSEAGSDAIEEAGVA